MDPYQMTFTGSLIEDLMAAVERAEERTQSEAALVSSVVGCSDASSVEPWAVSGNEHFEYDAKLMGVA